MAELELLRSLPFDVTAPSDEARARARERLLRHARRARPAGRRRLLVPVAAGAVLAAVVALTLVGRDGGGDAAAAVALRHAAAVARQQSPPQAIAPGQFWYSKAIQAYLVIAGDRHGWVALDPKVREIWQGPTGGLLRERSAPPQFLSPSDREHWISAGRPEVSARAASDTLPPAEPLDLPTDPGLLYAKLHGEAVGNANGTSAEMLTEVGDALRETDASPALRAALYEVAARIPGVELVGPVHDRMGRPGLAVASSSAAGHERQELIFDPKTSALLGEEYRATAGNEFGYPAGTVVGYATYVSTGVANRLGARP